MKSKRFGNVLPVRLPKDVDHRIKLVATAAGVSKSAVMRMAIAYGLPNLEGGKFKFRIQEAAR